MGAVLVLRVASAMESVLAFGFWEMSSSESTTLSLTCVIMLWVLPLSGKLPFVDKHSVTVSAMLHDSHLNVSSILHSM